MRKMKYLVGFFLLFLMIGFATITVSLSIKGSAVVYSDLGDFKVYFSDVKVNDDFDYSIVKNEKELVFNVDLGGLGSTYKIEYEVTNASSVFDAEVSVSCTQGDDLLFIKNEFDVETNLAAKSSRNGVLTLKKLRVNTEDTVNYQVSCVISADMVGRNNEVVGDVDGPLFYLGKEVNIGGEKFNVIAQDQNTVSLLAKYNLGTDYRQSTTENLVSFSDSNGWKAEVDIDIQQYNGPVKTYVNEYVDYLNSNLPGIYKGDLISLNQLGNLGCDLSVLDAGMINDNCFGSLYKEWLLNNQMWWTKTSSTTSYVYAVVGDELFPEVYKMVQPEGKPVPPHIYEMSYEKGVRPVITYYKAAFEKELVYFKIQAVAYGDVYTSNVYVAEKGMTWEEWAESEYNTSSFAVYGQSISNGNGGYLSDVSPTVVISNGGIYQYSIEGFV